MTPQGKRIAWIVGLAAGGAALVGGVAYVAAKSIGTTQPGGATPAPSAPGTTAAPTLPTFVHGTQQATTPPTVALAYLGANANTDATAGAKLTVTIPAKTGFVSAASIQSGAGASEGPGSNPVLTKAADGSATVTMTLSGSDGWLIISGVDVSSQGTTSVVTIGNPSGSPQV